MGKPAARMGDTVTTCGDPPAPVGKIIATSPNVMINKLPAAKQNDQVMAVDIHIVLVPSPGGPVPTPLPHVFSGMLNQQLSATVKINGMPAAVVGSVAQAQPPHIPMPPGTAFQIPPQNRGNVTLGSTNVFIGGGGGGGGGGGASGGKSAGGGGGGAAGAADSGDGGGPSGEGERHKLDVQVQDKGGFPIQGAQYKAEAPDGSISRGALTGHIKQDVKDTGDHEITLQAVTKMAWSKKEARSGDKVKAQVEAVGYEDGTEAVITVWAKDLNRPPEPVKTFEGLTLSGGKVEAEWTYEWEDDATEDSDDSSAGQSEDDTSEGADDSQTEEQQESQEDSGSDSDDDPGPGDTEAQDSAAEEPAEEEDSDDNSGSSTQSDDEPGPQTTANTAEDSDDDFPYSSPKFYFTVDIEGQRTRSSVLEFRDDIEIELKDTEGNAVADAAYRVFLPNGEVREGTLDGNGYAKIENVPPGDWDVEFPESGFVME